jgi:hypothetical protein
VGSAACRAENILFASLRLRAFLSAKALATADALKSPGGAVHYRLPRQAAVTNGK